MISNLSLIVLNVLHKTIAGLMKIDTLKGKTQNFIFSLPPQSLILLDLLGSAHRYSDERPQKVL